MGMWSVGGRARAATGAIVVVPAAGPAEAGLLAQDRPPVKAPLTAHVEGDLAEPSKVADPLPAVAVTAAFAMSKLFESLLRLWLASPGKDALAVAVPTFVLEV